MALVESFSALSVYSNGPFVTGTFCPPFTNLRYSTGPLWKPGLHHESLWTNGDETGKLSYPEPRLGDVLAIRVDAKG